MIQGTKAKFAWRIADNGFATLSDTDPGYFGKGIYFTSDIEYAWRFAKPEKTINGNNQVIEGPRAFVIAMTIPGNIFPVTKSCVGTTCEKGFQSHYTMVENIDNAAVPISADQLRQPHKYVDELVLFQDPQCLPLFIVYYSAEKVLDEGKYPALDEKSIYSENRAESEFEESGGFQEYEEDDSFTVKCDLSKMQYRRKEFLNLIYDKMYDFQLEKNHLLTVKGMKKRELVDVLRNLFEEYHGDQISKDDAISVTEAIHNVGYNLTIQKNLIPKPKFQQIKTYLRILGYLPPENPPEDSSKVDQNGGFPRNQFDSESENNFERKKGKEKEQGGGEVKQGEKGVGAGAEQIERLEVESLSDLSSIESRSIESVLTLQFASVEEANLVFHQILQILEKN